MVRPVSLGTHTPPGPRREAFLSRPGVLLPRTAQRIHGRGGSALHPGVAAAQQLDAGPGVGRASALGQVFGDGGLQFDVL
jgi:hypothetical protein